MAHFALLIIQAKVCSYHFASHPYNTHRVPFRFTTSFIHFSSVQSTRCPLFFCSPAAPLKAAFTLRLLIAHVVPPFRKASLRFTCIVQPPPYPDGKFTPAASYGAGIAIRSSWLYCQPLCGGSLSASVHSFLILSGGHLTARQHLSADKCAARLCFFFAAGAFTGRLDTFCYRFQESITDLCINLAGASLVHIRTVTNRHIKRIFLVFKFNFWLLTDIHLLVFLKA